MAGSSQSGEDIEAGRTNRAESMTVLQGGRPSELDVPFNGPAVFEVGPDRGEQFAERTLSGVLGRGWNGKDSPIQRQPGAGVIGVGAPNRGPGMIGLGGGVRMEVTSLLNNLGEDGLGGTGVIGLGGPGSNEAHAAIADDVAFDIPSQPGAGVVGEGGRWQGGTPSGNGPGVVGIAGGRSGSPKANLTQPDLAATANVGVVGFGGDRPNVGAGVRGVGGVNTTLSPQQGGPGVVGVAGGAVVPSDSDTAFVGVGVAGVGTRGGVMGTGGGAPVPPVAGYGVMGVALSGVGVVGDSSTGIGVSATSRNGAAVAGSSTSDRGGTFRSAEAPQLRLIPLPANIPNPSAIPATAQIQPGDFVVTVELDKRGDEVASLYFCTSVTPTGQASWKKLA